MTSKDYITEQADKSSKSPLALNLDQVRDFKASEEAKKSTSQLAVEKQESNKVVNLGSLKGFKIDNYVEPKSPVADLVKAQEELQEQ